MLPTADSRLCSRGHGPVGQALRHTELVAAPKPGQKSDPATQPWPPQVSRGPALVLQALQVSRQESAGSAVQAHCGRYARISANRPPQVIKSQQRWPRLKLSTTTHPTNANTNSQPHIASSCVAICWLSPCVQLMSWTAYTLQQLLCSCLH